MYTARGGLPIELTSRQYEIVKLITEHEPITGEQIATQLGFSRPTLRSDLSVLMMLGMIDAKPKVGYFIGPGLSTNMEKTQQFQSIKVKAVQGKPVTVKESTLVKHAVETMFSENVGSLVVLDPEGHLTGIISRKDLLKVTLANLNAGNMPVSMVMTRQPNIITVDPKESIIAAAEKMMKHEVDSLPVVGQNNIVLGRVTKTTMTRVLLKLYFDNCE